ncbi:MAG: PP2C family serine/threonine-protein phosphatase [Elusimicrobiota bacterium]
MASFETAEAVEAADKSAQDRVAVFSSGAGVTIAVADGAGGMSGGAEAADAVIAGIGRAAGTLSGDRGWAEALARIDRQIEEDPLAGMCAAVVVELTPEGITGASAGDVQAWIMDGDEAVDLTRARIRKPLMGSGIAMPVQFYHGALTGTLLAATDGLFDYAKREDIIRASRESGLKSLPGRLIELARPASGRLWDDIGLAVCRKAR